MAKPSSGVGAVIIPLLIFAVALIVEITLKKKEKQAKRDAELKEMLNKPLETFGSPEIDDLAKKYESNNSVAEENKTEYNVSNTYSDVPYTKFCTVCGSTVELDHLFCSNCGSKIN